MTLPTTGKISLVDIYTEFGGDKKLKSYYKGGTYVTANDYAPNVPSSGKITEKNFYGAKKNTLNTIELLSSQSFTIPSTLIGPITYLIVGGGGGGAGAGSDEGGGAGGAGGLIVGTAAFTPGETITATIGGGGGLYASGGDTTLVCSLGTIIALGGGGGSNFTGNDGGSGSGGTGPGGYHRGGYALQPSQLGLSAGLGNNGAGAPQSDNYPGGGGGGAGGAGVQGGSNNGGAPIANPISGSTVGYKINDIYYLAGGGSGRKINENWITYTAGSGYGGDGAWGYPNKQGGSNGASGSIIIQGYW